MILVVNNEDADQKCAQMQAGLRLCCSHDISKFCHDAAGK